MPNLLRRRAPRLPPELAELLSSAPAGAKHLAVSVLYSAEPKTSSLHPENWRDAEGRSLPGHDVPWIIANLPTKHVEQLVEHRRGSYLSAVSA